jgi:hypothetical protein
VDARNHAVSGENELVWGWCMAPLLVIRDQRKPLIQTPPVGVADATAVGRPASRANGHGVTKLGMRSWPQGSLCPDPEWSTVVTNLELDRPDKHLAMIISLAATDHQAP